MSIIQKLAEFGAGLRYSDLDRQTAETAKQSILDGCGNVINGRYHAEAQPVLAYALKNELSAAGSEVFLLPGEQETRFTLRGALFAAAAMGRLADMGNRI